MKFAKCHKKLELMWCGSMFSKEYKLKSIPQLHAKNKPLSKTSLEIKNLVIEDLRKN